MIEVDIAQDDADLLVVTENGWGKRTPIRDYPVRVAAGLGEDREARRGEGQARRRQVVRDGYQVMLISTAAP